MLQDDFSCIEGTVPGANDFVTESVWKQPVPRENSVTSRALIPFALEGTVPLPEPQKAVLLCKFTPSTVQLYVA